MRYFTQITLFSFFMLALVLQGLGQNTFPGTGNVGIGTTSPNAPIQTANSNGRKFVIYETANNDHQVIGLEYQANQMIYQVSTINVDQIFRAGATSTSSGELMRIKGNGLVGIGTPSPSYLFHVAGTAGIDGLLKANSGIQFGDGSVINSTTAFGWGLSGQGVFSLNNWNIGSGNTSPNAPFQTGNSVGRKFIMYEGANNDHQVMGLEYQSNQMIYQVSNQNVDQVFRVGVTSTSSSELLRLKGTGNIGIGTPSPTYLLHVAGTTGIDGLLKASGGIQFGDGSVINSTTAFGWGISGQGVYSLSNRNIGSGNNSPNAPFQTGNSVGRKFIMYEGANNDHQVMGLEMQSNQMIYQVSSINVDQIFRVGATATSSSELLRLKGTGNVGIGTPSPTYLLHVAGTAGIDGLLKASGGVQFGDGSVINSTTAFGWGISGQGVYSLNNRNIGSGNNSPNAPFQTGNSIGRKFILYEAANNDHQVLGLEYQSNQMVYQVSNQNVDQVFRVGVTSTSSSELVRFKGTGNVGIGTPSPTSLLHVAGTAGVDGVLTARSGIQFADGSVMTSAIKGLMTTTGWSVVGLNMCNINSGNVGIGTNNPVAKLSVSGNGIFSGLLTVSGGLQFADGTVMNSASSPTVTWTNTGTYLTHTLPVNIQNTLKLGTGSLFLNGTNEYTGTSNDIYTSNADPLYIQDQQGGGNTILNLNNGSVLVGKSSPTTNERLSVAGDAVVDNNLRVGGAISTNGLQVTAGSGAGKVLTSDGSGNATWQTPTSTWTLNGNTATYGSGGINFNGDLTIYSDFYSASNITRTIGVSEVSEIDLGQGQYLAKGTNLTINAGECSDGEQGDSYINYPFNYGGDLMLNGGTGSFGGNVIISSGIERVDRATHDPSVIKSSNVYLQPSGYGNVVMGTGLDNTTLSRNNKLTVNGNIKILGSSSYLEFSDGSKLISAQNANIWSLNGTNAYYNGGNVGIGTNAPQASLAVAGNKAVIGGNAMIGNYGSSDATTEIQSSSASTLNLISNISSGGNRNSLALYSDAQYGSGIAMFSSGTNQPVPFNFFNGGATRLQIYPSGDVGIGTTIAPTAKLEVVGDAKVNGSINITGGFNGPVANILNPARSGDNGCGYLNIGKPLANGASYYNFMYQANPSGGEILTINAAINGGWANNMTLFPTGQVSIGTSTFPSAASSLTKLAVDGEIFSTGNISTNGILNSYRTPDANSNFGGQINLGIVDPDNISPSGWLIVNQANFEKTTDKIVFARWSPTNWVTAMSINKTGQVVIGSGDAPAAASCAMFYVDGYIASKEVRVSLTNWCDYVFDETYKLKPLEEVEAFIKTNKHLPEVPSEKEVVENGVGLGDMSKMHMKKIEELTLYMIELKKQNDKLSERNDKMEAEISQLKKLVSNK